MEPLIQLRNLEKVVEAGPNKFYLLRRINLDIQAGEFVTIMGPSGAGKSTLLSIIGMLDGAWSGDFYFLGEAVHKLNVKKRNELHKANIGFVFQSYHLIDNLTVFENLEVPLSYKNVPHKERVRCRIKSASVWSATRWIDSTSWARKTFSRTSSRAASSNWSAWRAR